MQFNVSLTVCLDDARQTTSDDALSFTDSLQVCYATGALQVCCTLCLSVLINQEALSNWLWGSCIYNYAVVINAILINEEVLNYCAVNLHSLYSDCLQEFPLTSTILLPQLSMSVEQVDFSTTYIDSRPALATLLISNSSMSHAIWELKVPTGAWL